MIVDKLFWPKVPELLESVGSKEPSVCSLRDKIVMYISEALVPLLAYSKQFVQYIELANMTVTEYLQ